MDHKSWLWKKKSFEKTMIAAEKGNKGNEDEGTLAYEAELERNLNISNEKLSTALAEINAKDDIAKKQTHIAREAIQGWEKAEEEVLALKKELEKTTQKTEASEERLYSVDAALKECMHQLHFVREEQEKRIHEAVLKTSREYEKKLIIVQDKLSESNRRLSKLASENTQLTKSLFAKEKIIDELHVARSRLDSDLSNVMSKLESIQRDNNSLSYEVRVLEKELEIRNEERDFNRRTADVAHRQHLESVKKIAKMETEAQRLRVLVRKRLPGPAAVSKMKNEVEILGRKSNVFPFPTGFDTSGKQLNFLTEQLCAMEDENRVLKEFLNRKTNEQSKSQTTRTLVTCHDFNLAASSSDMGSDEKASMAESWAPSLKTIGTSDIGLMDDFVEMEKLATCNMNNKVSNSEMNKSIERLIELINGIRLCGKDQITGYTVRVLQWKTSELGGVLETFLQSCTSLLNGKTELENFAKELTLTLEWIVNHCFSLQDVDWDETRSENEMATLSPWKLKDDLEVMESTNAELEHKLESEVSKSESLIIQLRESEKAIENLEKEVECLKQEKDMIEDQMGVEMKEKEDLDEQLIEAIGDYSDVCRISTSSEEQPSNKNSFNQEMESRNFDEPLILLPESVTEREIKNIELDDDEKRLQNEREIIAASEKLAECQETILTLGKQLKAMASPRNPCVPDRLVSNPTYESPPSQIPDKTNHQRISLLDKMMAEDAARAPQSSNHKAVMDSNSDNMKVKSAQRFLSVNGIKHQEEEEALVNFLSIVPSKKKKSGMLRKLLWSRKKSN